MVHRQGDLYGTISLYMKLNRGIICILKYFIKENSILVYQSNHRVIYEGLYNNS